MLTLAFIFLLHWIGDFVFQTRWMAENKSSNTLALTLHVFVYSLVFVFGLQYLNYLPEKQILWFAAANFALHWITDITSSQFTKYFKQQKNDHAFFATIGLDQLVHQVCLIGTYVGILGVH